MSKKKKKKLKDKKLKTYSKKTLRSHILSIFGRYPNRGFNYKQIAKRLEIKDDITRQLITVVLYELTESEKLEEIHIGKFRLKSRSGSATGKVELTAYGSGYFISEELPDDVYISKSNLNYALHNDLVRICILPRKHHGRIQGEIVEILERGRDTFVGIVEISTSFAFLVSTSQNMPHDIFIPLEKLKGAKHGQKAIARILEWSPKTKNPVGEIADVLGYPGNNDVEMHAILAEFELPYKFPENVDKAAEKISEEIPGDEIAARRDFRDTTTFTIDPGDAKDFDDALSIRKLESGNWEIGIHIADVTHYVHTGTIIDNEGYERGTSVYLVDRVVPMLPERLSNFICSLRPDEEKLTFSAVFELNDKAEIKNQWFGRTVIRSNRRFSYDEALQIIETRKGDYSIELQKLNELALIIREKRLNSGAINFERGELRFKIDENGKPIEAYFKNANQATQLIEEFMLLANKKVAELIGKPRQDSPKTFVYRIHDKPDMEKLRSFSNFIRKFGYQLKTDNPKTVSNSLNKLLRQLKGKTEQDVIEDLAVRSMAKAVYSTQNIGHYGLSFNYYTHFTSPIRRFPDMMVHRLLERYLQNGNSVMQNKYEKMCKHASDMERKAVFAERASIKYKMAEYMKDKVGNVYEGIISGIIESGMFVELVDNKIEGRVSTQDMDDDYYVFDAENLCLTGQHNKTKYQLGDLIKVQIVRVNIPKKQIDMMVYDGDLFY